MEPASLATFMSASALQLFEN